MNYKTKFSKAISFKNLLFSILFPILYVNCSPNTSEVVIEEEVIQPTEEEITVTPVDTSNPTTADCINDADVPPINTNRASCDTQLEFVNETTFGTENGNRTISTNNIPAHKVGQFGRVPNGVGPNTIGIVNESFNITLTPEIATQYTPLLLTTGRGGPQYSFGLLLNGLQFDPVAAEPWPHEGFMNPNVNWEWNLEALNIQIGLDCNTAHVQPTGKYHYHGNPTLYIEANNIDSSEMTLIGYAADGFPIYYKYAYSDANDSKSEIVAMVSSYRLKEGNRPGNGISAPCGEYNGVYTNDYEYSEGLGNLDLANGREGITPEYPNGTYYYVITEEFPSIPRYFRGTPSLDFKLGPG